MTIICTYCGSECGEREQENGRCGSCACFFTGTEVVLDDPAPPSPTPAPKAAAPKPPINAPKSELASLLESMMPDADEVLGGFNPNTVEPDLPGVGESSSEGLIQPRKLSPQYRKRVERTWQSTFGGPMMSAESTLNSASPSMGTKNECPTLSIATRKILRADQADRKDIQGDYELKEVIGEGSMGRVWSAKQTSLDRNVAVKVPMAELAGSGSVGESQFISEVVVTGQLEHPNIVPIYELGRDANGLPFYSMKHVQGRAWNETIREKTTSENIEILMKVCDAIAFAHDRNFLHRDIKPHNVMVGEFGEVSVMDWGIAVAVERDPDKPWASVATGPAGTPAYMAPEMAAHNPSELGVVSDIYLLGATLYEIVSGTPPHPKTGDTRAALLAAAANEIVPTAKTGELIDIARRAMATNQVDRYQTVKDFQDAIREYQSHRESIKLSESAQEHYHSAVEAQSSDEFARCRFAYEEALRLWDGNHSARQGLKIATLAHAKNALDQENFELGISILDANDASHRELLVLLESRRAQRRRLLTVSKIAAVTAVIAILSVVVVTFYSYGELKDSAEKLASEKEVAVEQRTIAQSNAEEARRAEKAARDAETKAKSAEQLALVAKNEARGAEMTARQEKKRAEEAAYASEIGLAAESIRRNDFEKAKRILEKMDPASGQPVNEVMSRLRHLEWGLLRDSAAPATMHTLISNVHVESVASSLDGSVIVAGTDTGQVYFWRNGNLAVETPTSELDFGASVTAVCVSKDGSTIAVAGVAKSAAAGAVDENAFAISVFSADKFNADDVVMRLQGHQAAVMGLAFDSDGKRLVSCASDRKAIVWDLSDGKPASVMRDHLEKDVYDANFSPDGKRVVTACEDGRVRVWAIDNGRQDATKIHDFRGHDGPVYCAAFSLDGNAVFSGGYDRRLLRWGVSSSSTELAEPLQLKLDERLEGDGDAMSQVQQIGDDSEQHAASIQTLAVGLVDGRECILTGANDNTIRVWTAPDRQWTLQKVLRGHGRWVQSCVFSANGKQVVSGAFDGVKRWDWQQYELPRELYPVAEQRLGKHPSEIGLAGVADSKYSADGRWVATAFNSGTVAVWDLSTNDRTAGQLLGEGHALLTATGRFFDHGSQLLTAAADNTTRIWNVARGTQSTVLPGTGYRGVAVAVRQPDAKRTVVITGSDDRLTPAKLWLLADDRSVNVVPLLQDQAESLIEGQSRTSLASASTSDLMSDSQFRSYRQRIRQIPDATVVALSATGERFAIGDAVGQCFVFRFAADDKVPELIGQLTRQGSAIADIEFVPGTPFVITAVEDGTIRQWNSEDGTSVTEFPWSGPVTDLDVSNDGQYLLVGHAPIPGRDDPIVERFAIARSEQENSDQVTQLLRVSEANSGDTKQRPSVQSVQFIDSGSRALVSLFFPAGDQQATSESRSRRTGYQMAIWDMDHPGESLEWIQTAETGEIAMASFEREHGQSRLLVVGGKGARLWESDVDHATSFQQLARSFRPSASVNSIDFSIDPVSGLSERLVTGDSEGNLRVWQFSDGRWTENIGAAQGLSGKHSHAIVAARFNPRDPDEFISLDQRGQWRRWQLSPQNVWESVQSERCELAGEDCYSATYSPIGRRVLFGGSASGECWHRMDDGAFARFEQVWEPGPIREAIVSADGVWWVTSDGDRNVAFWDANLQRLAKLNEDDALAVRSMDVSDDRRRLVTGQGKRIVVWDTSRVARTADESSNDHSEHNLISELLTLEEHRAVVAVNLSANDRDLLSAGTEGRTVIWKGREIAPVAITPSSPQLFCRIGGPAVLIDDGFVVSDPSQLVDFEGTEFVVDSNQSPAANAMEELIEFRTSDASVIRWNRETGDLLYQAHENLVPIVFGKNESIPDSTGTLIRVRLNKAADVTSVQALLRSLTYRADIQRSESPEASETNADGLSSAGSGARKLQLRIEGLKYRDADRGQLDGQDNKKLGDELFPDSIEATIEIDLNRTETPAVQGGDLAVETRRSSYRGG